MPLYTYACPKCGTETAEFNTVAQRHAGPECCGSVTALQITATQVQATILGGGAFHGYKCPITGDWVTSRKQRKEIMARHGVVEAGDTGRAGRERHQRMLHDTNGTGVSD